MIVVTPPLHWIDHLYYHIREKNFKHTAEPVFIIGNRQTGTTLFHFLLSPDGRMGFVTTCHSVYLNNLQTRFLFRPIMKVLIPYTGTGDHVRLSVNLPQVDEFIHSNLRPYSSYQFIFFLPD